MKGFWFVGVLSLALSFAGAQNLASPHDFVSRLYDSYEHPKCPECPNIFGKEASHVFSPSLLRLIRRDEARTPQGCVGALDFDPICACQDPDGLPVLNLEIRPTRPNRATAEVLIGYTADAKQAIRLSLLRTSRGWRVDDVSTNDEASLRKLLNGGKRP